MTLLHLLFDAVLALALPVIARRSLLAPGSLEAVVLFVSFGLLMSLAWVRLEAPDVALAEAAIGAGLTGALLLGAAARVHPRGAGTPRRSGGSRDDAG